jgi:serine-type D-Ala-D-Ala carboxypeptidase (penicillin-binding protein 5/6)
MKNILLAFLLIMAAVPAAAQEEIPGDYTAAMVVEPTTGTVIYAKNHMEALPAASMTKMMTLLVTLDAIQKGAITWDTPVTTSARASRMGGSQVYLRHREVFSVRDLVAATMVHSANDAALALAEAVSGTSDAFVHLMNLKAKQLGLKCSQFYSPHGLPGDGVPDDSMCPYDLARLGVILSRHPDMRRLAGTQTMPFRDGAFTMYNPNHLIRNYPGAWGIKTGFHNKAGFCVTGAARRGNMDLIVVVMGSKNKRNNFDIASQLLSRGFAEYELVQPVRKGMRLPNPVGVEKGAAPNVPVVAGGTANVLVKTSGEEKIETVVAGTNVAAPVAAGQQVGMIVIRKGGKPVASVPALAAAAVGKQPWWKSWWPF